MLFRYLRAGGRLGKVTSVTAREKVHSRPFLSVFALIHRSAWKGNSPKLGLLIWGWRYLDAILRGHRHDFLDVRGTGGRGRCVRRRLARL
jgi:hypothetical protein